MRLLILGGAGYIGNILAQESVFESSRVTIVDSLVYDQGPTLWSLVDQGVTFVRGDVRDCSSFLDHIQHADVIIHLAALVGAPVCERFKSEAEAINATSVREIVKHLSKHQQLIVPNTNSGYGTASTICSEDTPLNPISHYGCTKLRAETYALAHPNTTVFRLATVFGISPRMRLDLLVNQFVYLAVFNNEITIFDGNLKRNFVHVRDVAGAILWAIKRRSYQVYNLGCDQANMTKSELAQLVCQISGAKIIEVAGTDPDRRDYSVSSAKLTAAGFTAMRSLEYGIKELMAWYKVLPTDGFRRAWTITDMGTANLNVI